MSIVICDCQVNVGTGNLRELEEGPVVSLRGAHPPAWVVEGLDVDGLTHQAECHVHQSTAMSRG